MTDPLLSAGRVVTALFLVVLNGFFVAAEFAYVRIRSTTVDSLVDAGKPGAETLEAAMDNLDDYLAVTQLGITLASLGLGWIGEPAVAALIEPVLGGLLPQNLVHIVAFAIGFGTITFLHVVFGELAPKTIAIAQAERIALLVAPPMRLFYYLFVPGIVVFNGTANAFTRAIGVPPASETDETLTEAEIRRVLAQSGEEGQIATDEVEMIEGVFELDDVTAGDVMVPRPDVATVQSDLRLSALRQAIVEAGHTRYPVADADDPDRIVGLVDTKDILRAETVGEAETIEAMTAADLARDIPAFPETTAVSDLLSTLQDRRAQMAVVIDEWGGFAGIVTIEDVVEELVGDLQDAFDVPESEPSIVHRDDGSIVVDGGVSLASLNGELATAFAHDAVRTVGGLVLGELGRPPSVGDTLAIDGYQFEVTEIDGMRVTTVVLTRADESENESSA